MMSSSQGGVNTTPNYYEYDNASGSYVFEEEYIFFDLVWIILQGIILVICCIGFVGNGYIIWLLGFQIKKNFFTTFILNLAITDFGYLTCMFIYSMQPFTNFQGVSIFYRICAFFLHMTCINANFLLTAISIDRCVAVLFPIWHCCSRPKHLSTNVCVLLWIFSFLLSGSMNIMKVFVNDILLNIHFLVAALVCLPLITLSTAILFFKVRRKSNQKNQSRLLLMIAMTLLCFLILAFPLNVFAVIITFSNIESNSDMFWEAGIIMCSCLNSSINPVIYFLVGRKKGAQSKESMKVILQKVFKEEETTGGATEESNRPQGKS
ncbi:mas-related G-protein coupled receptor member H-like [Erythrolamprus reginae]|uniref:mas-related G-protein coupled receptor member H-like n=1 Tax=Erythrolamprus reginae TaxID=121349 RepID=UPI00396CCC67